jgi:hypothetical protein
MRQLCFHFDARLPHTQLLRSLTLSYGSSSPAHFVSFRLSLSLPSTTTPHVFNRCGVISSRVLQFVSLLPLNTAPSAYRLFPSDQSLRVVILTNILLFAPQPERMQGGDSLVKSD